MLQGCSPKKEVGTPETRLRQRFLNSLGLHTRTLIHVRKIATADLWSCQAIQLLVFGVSVADRSCCTEIILHCISVSNQLQHWTNVCTNFSPKIREWGRRPPLSKKVRERRPPASPPHYTPVVLLRSENCMHRCCCLISKFIDILN